MGATTVLMALAAGCGDGSATSSAPAPSASSAACTRALDAAPATVLDAVRDAAVTAVGTAAWGDPAITVRCGLEAPAATTDVCQNVDGLDWVVRADGQDGGDVVFESFGRAPALEVVVPASYGAQNASGALVDLAPVAQALPADGHSCD